MYVQIKKEKKFLSNLNPVILIGLIFVLILLRTTAEPIFPTLFGHWDILLAFIIYFGQRRTLVEGITLCIIASHLYSLCSTAPIGVFVLKYLVIFIVARSISFIIYANRFYAILGLMFGLSLLGRVALLAIASTFGHDWSFFSQGTVLIGSLVLNSLLGFVVYRLIGLVDLLTAKVPVRNIQLWANKA